MSKVDEAQRVRLARLEAETEEPDTSDIPEPPSGAWTTAEVGKFYRPRKEAITIRIDADVLQWFRQAAGAGGIRLP